MLWMAAALLLVTQSPEPAQVNPDGSSTVDAVTVQAERDAAEQHRRAVSAFVRDLAQPTRRGRLARWDRGLCPGVVGLPQAHGSFLAERIAEEARRLRLEVGEPGCRPDILVLVTSDAQRAAAQLHRQHPAYFAAGQRREVLDRGGGEQRLGDFLTRSVAVRWWHVARLAASDGRPLGRASGAPAIYTTRSSRLASNWKEGLNRVLVIVDTTQLKGVTYEQLAGYLAMVALAQLDPEAEPSTLPTIMTLFADLQAGHAPAESLTEWDRAYLRGLYASPDDARNLNAQRGAIRRSLVKARTQPE